MGGGAEFLYRNVSIFYCIIQPFFLARKVFKEDLRIKKEKIVQGVGGVSILQMEINIKTYHHFPEFVHKLHLIKSNSPLPAGNISPSTIRCLLLEILCLFTILPQRNVFSVRTQISMPHPYYSRILVSD